MLNIKTVGHIRSIYTYVGTLSRQNTFVPEVISDDVYIATMKERFRTGAHSPEFYDKFMSELVNQWRANHAGGSGNAKQSSGLFGGGGIMGSGIGGIRPIKCSALLIINESSSPIMILGKDLHYGETYHIFGKRGDDSNSNITIPPMTSMCVFICGSIPKTLESSEAQFTLRTSAFDVTFGRKKKYLSLLSSGSFKVEFVDKEYTADKGSDFGKIILLVT